MKRDMDLVRDLLLEIEVKDDGSGQLASIDNGPWSEAQVVDHLFQLAEQGLIQGHDMSHMQARAYKPRRLTAAGHDYLDTIRYPEIWRLTKDGAAAAGGFTVEMIGDLAKGLIKTQIKKHTGVEI